MSKISDLRNGFDPEQTAQALFDLIKNREDDSILKEVIDFDDNITSKSIVIFQKMLSLKNFDSAEFFEKKNELEVCANNISNIKKIFEFLDQKIDNEIKTNFSLSTNEKNNLNNNFLFDLRVKHADLLAIEYQYQRVFTMLNQKIKQNQFNQLNKPVIQKKSFLDKIKSLKDFSLNSNNKNKLK